MEMFRLLTLLPFIIGTCFCDKSTSFFLSKLKTEVYSDGGLVSHEEVEGTYGQGSHVNHDGPIKGILVQVQTKVNKSDKGCSPIDPDIIPSRPWIALVQRGDCSFSEKMDYAAKKSNASAVIIYNCEDSKETLSESEKTLMIKVTVKDVTAIFIRYKKGRSLLDLLEKYKGKVNVTITVHGPKEAKSTPNTGQLNNTSVLFVSISFIVLIIISLAWLVFYYIQRCRFSNAKERLSRRLANAAKKAIAKIPQRSVRIGDKELDSDADQCAVCIEPYKISDVIRVLPCKHVFHKSCVDPWLLDQRSCPMCKMDILQAFGMHLNDSQESVPQDAESGLMSSTPAAEDSEPLSHSDDQGAVGGVKIVLYQHPIRYNRDGAGSSGQFIEPDFSSECSERISSPVAQCHVECTSHALVEHTTDNDEHDLPEHETYDDSTWSLSDEENDVRHSLITGLPTTRRSNSALSGGTGTSSNMGSKSLRKSTDSGSIVLSIKD